MGISDASAEADFAAFVRARRQGLVRLGISLCGDRQRGEDIAQQTLDRLWQRWAKVRHGGDPWPYAVRTAVTVAATESRRRWRTAEISVRDVPDAAAACDEDSVERREVISGWLAELPTQQRTAVVLRFLFDLSIEQTAEAMGCSDGSVKTHTSRALAALRRVATPVIIEEAR